MVSLLTINVFYSMIYNGMVSRLGLHQPARESRSKKAVLQAVLLDFDLDVLLYWIVREPPVQNLSHLNCGSFTYATPSLWNELPNRSPRASSDTVFCTFSYHTWQFIIFTIFTITACIFSYSLSVSFWTQDLALQQILSSIYIFLYYRTDYTDSRTI